MAMFAVWRGLGSRNGVMGREKGGVENRKVEVGLDRVVWGGGGAVGLVDGC